MAAGRALYRIFAQLALNWLWSILFLGLTLARHALVDIVLVEPEGPGQPFVFWRIDRSPGPLGVRCECPGRAIWRMN